MFNSPVLNLVILLSFTYFIGSLILSAINESIAAGLKTRAKDLKKTLENLLLDDDWKKFVREKIFSSQHIQSLMVSKDKFPSYIPAGNFVLAIIEQIKSENYTKENILKGIAASPIPPAMKSVLENIWAKAQANVSEAQSEIALFEKELEGFYNNAMERASGWYKRKTRKILLAIGFVLSALLNIDTIKIANDALNDKDKLTQAADKISASMGELKQLVTYKVEINGKNVISEIIDTAKEKVKQLTVVYNDMGGYELGYTHGSYFDDWIVNGFASFLWKVIGLIITTFALQLGSNYWFDILNKAVNLRATGKKPDEKKPV